MWALEGHVRANTEENRLEVVRMDQRLLPPEVVVESTQERIPINRFEGVILPLGDVSEYA